MADLLAAWYKYGLLPSRTLALAQIKEIMFPRYHHYYYRRLAPAL